MRRSIIFVEPDGTAWVVPAIAGGKGIVSAIFGGAPKPPPPPDNSAVLAAQAEQQRKLDAQSDEQKKQKSSLAALGTGAAGRARQTVSLKSGRTGVQSVLGTE